MSTIYVYSYHFDDPVGDLGIAEANGAICRVIFDCPLEELGGVNLARLFKTEMKNCTKIIEALETDLLKQAALQIAEYLKGKRAAFKIPVRISGAAFTKLVYNELLKIPAGQTRSYKEVAEAAGNPNACRAVGSINSNNNIPIFIPCHRVIGSNGALTGYAGGLPMKQYLLDIEQKYYL